jgi:protocatechuate 3,4-dioxygenase beta subunit
MSSDNTSALRRRALRAGTALLAGSLVSRWAGAVVAPTPEQPLGPFYPRVLPADRDSDLVQIRGRAEMAQGTALYLDGSVTDGNGAPVTGALVEIWQCDVHGKYLRPADDSPGARDENFQGYGQARTDASGSYAFRTIRPVAYSGRPPHIHFQVSHPRYRKLVTQLYAQEASAAARGWAESSNPSLWVTFAPSARADGALAAHFDIVLAGAP